MARLFGAVAQCFFLVIAVYHLISALALLLYTLHYLFLYAPIQQDFQTEELAFEIWFQLADCPAIL